VRSLQLWRRHSVVRRKGLGRFAACNRDGAGFPRARPRCDKFSSRARFCGVCRDRRARRARRSSPSAPGAARKRPPPSSLKSPCRPEATRRAKSDWSERDPERAEWTWVSRCGRESPRVALAPSGKALRYLSSRRTRRLQGKDIPVDQLFHKVVMIRDSGARSSRSEPPTAPDRRAEVSLRQASRARTLAAELLLNVLFRDVEPRAAITFESLHRSLGASDSRSLRSWKAARASGSEGGPGASGRWDALVPAWSSSDRFRISSAASRAPLTYADKNEGRRNRDAPC